MNVDSLKVSVIIPLHNQKEYVAESIDSVLRQSHKNIEIIIINDGSSDNPEDVLNHYSDRVIYGWQNNMGLSSARNHGIKLSTGQYVQLLDADDYLHIDKIKSQLSFMQENDSQISYCEVTQYDQFTNNHFLRYVGDVKDIFGHLFFTWLTYPLPVHSMLISKDIFSRYGGFPENLMAAEDRYFFSTLALCGETFSYHPFIGGARRLHSSNMNKNRLFIYENMVRYYDTLGGIESARKHVEEKYRKPFYDLVNANLSFMYLKDYESALPMDVLGQIRTTLRIRGVALDYSNIPFPAVPVKTISVKLLALLRRWRNIVSVYSA